MTPEQDPLPEGQWKFRRAFTYAVVLICLGLVGWIVAKLSDDPHLAGVAYALIGLCALLATFYLIAPSAETLVKILASVRLFRR